MSNLMQQLFNPSELDLAKRHARTKVQRYYHLLEGFGGDGGNHIAAVIRPDIALAAREANMAMRDLRKIDPCAAALPWTPYDEGN